MPPFPRSEALQFLMELEVGQICLDPWSTQIRFSEGGQITIEGRFEHIDAQGISHLHQEGEGRDTGPFFLSELIQERIIKLDVEPLLLTLHFSNGGAVLIRAEEGPYEDGQIYPPNHPDNPIIF